MDSKVRKIVDFDVSRSEIGGGPSPYETQISLVNAFFFKKKSKKLRQKGGAPPFSAAYYVFLENFYT